MPDLSEFSYMGDQVSSPTGNLVQYSTTTIYPTEVVFTKHWIGKVHAD